MAENNSRAVLKFNGGDAQKVLNLKYGVSRSVDVSGRVASDPSNALITITIEATDKSDVLESLLNGKYKPTTGEIVFNKSHEEGTLITLKWVNGYVIQHQVDFDPNLIGFLRCQLQFQLCNLLFGLCLDE